MNSGVIVGWNNGYCITCGGFYLNLSNDTARNAHTYYVLNYSQSLTPIVIRLNRQYNKNQAPIYVFVDWQPVTDSLYPDARLFVANIRTR